MASANSDEVGRGRLFGSETPLRALDGGEIDLAALRARTVLVVNVASKCGLTPQYAGLERLHRDYAERGFTVLGVPCNQFAGQEPGSAEQIREFCSSTYRVSFPLTEKLQVNGSQRHPMYRKLCLLADEDGEAGEVAWNFEKFLLAPGGVPVRRFRPTVDPESKEVREAIEALLDGWRPPEWKSAPAAEVRVGDRVRTESGIELAVTRIERDFFGDAALLALIEDSSTRWLKVPSAVDATVEILRA